MINRKRLMYGEWLTESEEDKRLRELAEAYHADCETYDRGICTGRHPKTGDAIPLTPYELGLVNKYARTASKIAIREGEGMGLTGEQVMQAIRKYAK